MTERLNALQTIATRSGQNSERPRRPFVASKHTTLEEAYAALGVEAGWPTKAIETHVKALRMAYYVDHGTDDSDKRKRTQALQVVNAAWEVIRRKRPAVGGLGSG